MVGVYSLRGTYGYGRTLKKYAPGFQPLIEVGILPGPTAQAGMRPERCPLMEIINGWVGGDEMG